MSDSGGTFTPAAASDGGVTRDVDRGALVVRNVGYNFLAQFWFTALAIVTTPYIVRTLGADLFGVYVLVTAILGYFAFLDLGLGAALTKYIAEYEASGNVRAVSRVVQTALMTYLVLGTVGALVIASGTTWLLEHVLSVPPADHDAAALAFYVAALGFLVNLPGQTFAVIPAALQRFDVIFWRTTIAGTASLVFTVAALALGYGLEGVVLANLVISAATAVAFYIPARRLLPRASFRPHLYLDELKMLLTFGLFKASQRFTAQLVFQLDRVVLALFLPISAVAYYAVPLALTQRIVRLVGNVSTAVFPAASALAGTHDARRIEQLYLRSMKLTALIAFSTSAIMIIYARPLMEFWISPAYEKESSGVLVILAVANLGYALTAIPSNTLDATGYIRVSTIFGWCAAATNVVLVFGLVPLIGLYGAAWAVFANAMVVVPLYLYYVHTRVFAISFATVARQALLRPLLALCALIPFMIGARSFVSNVAELVLLVALTVVGYVGTTILFRTYDDRDRALLRAFLRRADS